MKWPGGSHFTHGRHQHLAFAARRPVEERVRRSAKLRDHQEGHRNEQDKRPPSEFFNVLESKDAAHDENQRQMKEIGMQHRTQPPPISGAAAHKA